MSSWNTSMNEAALEAYLDGELAADKRAAVALQWSASAEARRKLVELKRLRAVCEKARWPEPDGDLTARLLRHWQPLMPLRTLGAAVHLGAAATLVLAVSLISLPIWCSPWIGGPRSDQRVASVAGQRHVAERPLTVPPSPFPSPRWGEGRVRGDTRPTNDLDERTGDVDQAAPGPAICDNPIPEVAAANVHEQLIIAAADRVAQERTRQRELMADSQENPADIVGRAIDVLMSADGADPRAVALDYFRPPGPWEDLLVETCGQSRGARRRAAVQLLGVVGPSRSMDWLITLGNDPEVRMPAAVALGQVADSLWLARRIQAEPRSDVQQQLLRALASQGSPRAARLFLNFVEQRRTSDVALAALEELPQPPVEAYWPFLDAPLYSLRVAAARALGRCRSPQLTADLTKRALQGPQGREALLALVASPRPEAQRVVVALNTDLHWRGALSAAASELQVIVR